MPDNEKSKLGWSEWSKEVKFAVLGTAKSTKEDWIDWIECFPKLWSLRGVDRDIARQKSENIYCRLQDD